MNTFIVGLLIGAVVMVLMVLVTRRSGRRARRAKFIASYAFPQTLRFKLDQAYPALSHEQTTTVLEGLRTWFGLLNANPRANLGMPSKAVDTAWHEFIFLTKDYAEFCDHAFGKFMHHTPHAQRSRQRREGLARTYGLGASTPVGGAVTAASRVGAGVVGASLVGAGVAGVAGAATAAAMSGRDLFALDQTLGIADGTAYSPEYLDKLQRQYETMRAAGTADGGSSSSGDSGGGGGDSKSHGSDASDSGSSGGGGSSCGGGCGGGGGGC